jgi:hypothetical protein
MAVVQQLRTTRETAEQFNLSEKSLANSRTTGSIRYRQSDIDAYIDANTFSHTGEVKAVALG